jgi:tRNA nucleotidyltransferase (CCA-adding enzyme)
MQVVTTHQGTDFDALASLVAASKLYPQARLYFPGGMNHNVRDFVALYRDALNVKDWRTAELAGVELLVITDTRQNSRIGIPSQVLDQVKEIHIFDHHQETAEDIRTDRLFYAEVGAITTLLVEMIREKEIVLSPFEATLFALGIYEDTGCLTYASTTARDVAALHHLWQVGVNLRVVSKFLNRPLSEEQRAILEDLLTSAEYHELRGARVAVTLADSANYVNGLSLLTHRLVDIEDVDVVFTVVSMEDRVYVVGRSRLENFDLREVLAAFGGKGHPRAASATVRNMSLSQVREKLVSALYRQMAPIPTAREIMSSPVRTVDSATTVDTAKEMMMRYGHSGFPVLEEGRLIGVISRRDLEKASHHGLGHAPVRGYMNRRPLTIHPDLPVKNILQLMAEHNVGRLPVLEGEAIAGIVTRTDVLRNLEGGQRITCSEEGLRPKPGDDLTPLINAGLPKKMQSLLLLVAQAADREQVNAYAVGGFIRDLLLGKPGQDLDLVVEPLAIPFAIKLKSLLGGQLVTHEQFGTAGIILSDGARVDLVTARQEFYTHPAALPEVEQAGLKSDLFRRDFTINTLAMSLNSPRFGHLIDIFHGVQDLEKGLIRVLYNLSFVEDPLRLLRAVRFERRFGFSIEETTFSLVENAVQTRVLDKVSRERIYEELHLALLEEKAPEIIARYFELGLAAAVFPGVAFRPKTAARLFAAREALTAARRNWEKIPVRPAVLYLAALLADLPYQEARHVCRRLRLHRDENEGVLGSLEALPALCQLFMADREPPPSAVFRALHDRPAETLLLLQATCDDSRVWKSTTLYWEKLRQIRPSLSGHDLIELGIKPGPGFQEVLRTVHDALLDGRVKNREEELALAAELIKNWPG